MKTTLAVLLLAITASAQQYQILYSFGTSAANRVSPAGTVAIDAKGNVYGVEDTGDGAVFELTAKRAGKIVHEFSNNTEGKTPEAGVTIGANGVLYGTTYYGGTNDEGTLFSLTPGATWRYAVVHNFGGDLNGRFPQGPLTFSAGELYGTTKKGFDQSGTVFTVDSTTGDYSSVSIPTPNYGSNVALGQSAMYGIEGNDIYSVSAGTVSTFYTFPGGALGTGPWGLLAVDAQGNLYGATTVGGNLNCDAPYGCGLVYELSPQGVETVLYTFTGDADGAEPVGVTMDSFGNLYGVTTYGGNLACTGNGNPPGLPGCGTIFEVSDVGALSTLYTWDGTAGSYPVFPVTLDSLGNLYGYASGGLNQQVSYVLFELVMP
jgi:uncharacterized repeat protein (TIGR03803 family)